MKKNNDTPDTEATEQPKPAPVPATDKTVKGIEVELKYGQCIVAPVASPDDEILTTLDDWNNLYNAGKNAGKFTLKAEKKSS